MVVKLTGLQVGRTEIVERFPLYTARQNVSVSYNAQGFFYTVIKTLSHIAVSWLNKVSPLYVDWTLYGK